jgi:Putative  PD-(D/E)XK family member, (DUF4420)
MNEIDSNSLYDLLSNSIGGEGSLRVEYFLPERDLLVGIHDGTHVFLSAREVVPMPEFKFASGALKTHQRIQLPGKEEIGPNFTLECYVETDSDLLAISSLYSGLIDLVGLKGSEAALCDAVSALSSYFSSRDESLKNRNTEIGLAGELCVMLAIGVGSSLIDAWHSDPFGTFDFVLNGERLEVKTSLSPQRVHNLRLTQNSPDVATLTYASVHCAESGDGSTISEISERITAELDATDKTKFRNKIERYPLDTFQMKFDVDSAVAGVRFISSRNIPSPIVNNSAILEVSWKCNFSLIDIQLDETGWQIKKD